MTTRHSMKVNRNGFFVAAASLFLCSRAVPAYAEGGDKRSTSGQFGINRRVVTHPGYTEVEGIFNMIFSLPFNVVNTSQGRAAWGPSQNRPSPYLGGGGSYYLSSDTAGDVEVDAGLQYDAWEWPSSNPDDPLQRTGIRGWGYIFRATAAPLNNPHILPPGRTRQYYVDRQFNQPQYWHPAAGGTGASVKWKSGSTVNSTTRIGELSDSYLNFRIYTGDDATTTTVEETGWIRMRVDKLPVSGTRHTVYWIYPSANVVPDPNNLDTLVSNARYSTTVQSFNPATPDRVVVGAVSETTWTRIRDGAATTTGTAPTISVGTAAATAAAFAPRGFITFRRITELGQIIEERKSVKEVDAANGVIVVDSPFAAPFIPLPGDSAEQYLRCDITYPNHPTSPWRGQGVFHSNMGNTSHGPRVKRVVAMTRADPASHPTVPGDLLALDGSWLDCLFSGGQVAPAATSSLRSWSASDVWQSAAGELNKKTSGHDAPKAQTTPGITNHLAYLELRTISPMMPVIKAGELVSLAPLLSICSLEARL